MNAAQHPPEHLEIARKWKESKKREGTSNTFIQLGAYGDILSILPVLYMEAQEGPKPKLIVSRKYADILDGVSYVEPIIFDGHYSEVERAEKAFAALKPRTAQVYGKPFLYTSESFQRDAWCKVGYDHRWEQLELVIDRRDPEREAALIQEHMPSDTAHYVLVCTSGASSVFPHRTTLMDMLDGVKGINVVDALHIQAERLYDMLALIDRADLFICNDTSLLHLAQASSTPVVALVNDADNGWLGSLRRANHVVYQNFLEFLPSAIKRVAMNPLSFEGSIVHVWSDYEMDDPTLYRFDVASRSWTLPQLRIENSMLWRDVRQDDDTALPYIRDMIELGLKQAEAVVLTNVDSGLVPEAEARIRRLLAAKGACFGYRFEHPEIHTPLTYHENIRGTWGGGVELIAITRSWWERFGHLMPDLILGRQFWDIVARDLIKQTGGGELYGCVFHEFHPSAWKQGMNAGNEHNTKIYNRWMKRHDTTRPFSGLYLIEQ
jgi:hypothetical protein